MPILLKTALLGLLFQLSPPPVAFDVVSIRPNRSGSSSVTWRSTDDGFVASNITLQMLIAGAWNIREALLFDLPGWAQSEHFDVNAKSTEAEPEALKKMSDAQRRAMMIAMLQDRFHLKVHPQTREMPVYDLVLAKGGPRIREDPALPDRSGKPQAGLRPGQMWWNKGEMNAIAVPLEALTRSLEQDLDRNIIDRTGLTAHYDLHLRWAPDPTPDSAAPPLFSALEEQLGLKLIPARGPVTVYVVDHVEPPTEN